MDAVRLGLPTYTYFDCHFYIWSVFYLQAVAESPVEGQALIGMAVTVSGIVVAIFFADLGDVTVRSNSEKKARGSYYFLCFL